MIALFRSGGQPIAGVSSVMPASTSATWRTSTGLPRRDSLPAILRRQPRSPASTVSAPVAAMSAALSATILSEISGYLTQNVPPKPQHTSGARQLAEAQPRDRGKQQPRLRLDAELAQPGTGIVIGRALCSQRAATLLMPRTSTRNETSS